MRTRCERRERVGEDGMRTACGWKLLLALGASLGTPIALPRPASACGGTFCDQGTPRSVNQSGENILFVHFEGRLEVHVQIRYQGDPARFAWLVPLPEEPEVEIGSQPLFDALLEGTAPVYGVRTTRVSCDGTVEHSESSGCGGATTGPTQTGIAPGSQSQTEAGMMADPIGKTVGSFEVSFLQPRSAGEVMTWLADNAFQVPAGTEDFLAPYIESGSVIAAIRFAPGAGVSEIHPIVFRFSAERASIPIQLTAVAATVDMRVRSFFLGQGRTAPSNYRHLTLNPVRLSWPGFVPAYENAVSRAVDETSDGRAFVTEYAGTSAMFDMARVRDPRWNSEAFAGLNPLEAIGELEAQGQLVCAQDGSSCELPHPLMLPLMQQYLPAPAGSLEGAFYACPQCMEDRVDHAAWDATAFAAEYEERVIAPAEHAQSLVQASPYLTRLLSFLSPEEMTADPVFHERTDLPEQSHEHWAERLERCGEPTRITFPDGRVLLEAGRSLFSSPLASLPSAERIEQVGEQGAPVVAIDNAAEIDDELARVNADIESGGDGAPDETSRRRRGSIGCHVVSPAWNQAALWAFALYLVHKRARRS
jgi:hypothetical protein